MPLVASGSPHLWDCELRHGRARGGSQADAAPLCHCGLPDSGRMQNLAGPDPGGALRRRRLRPRTSPQQQRSEPARTEVAVELPARPPPASHMRGNATGVGRVYDDAPGSARACAVASSARSRDGEWGRGPVGRGAGASGAWGLAMLSMLGLPAIVMSCIQPPPTPPPLGLSAHCAIARCPVPPCACCAARRAEAHRRRGRGNRANAESRE